MSNFDFTHLHPETKDITIAINVGFGLSNRGVVTRDAVLEATLLTESPLFAGCSHNAWDDGGLVSPFKELDIWLSIFRRIDASRRKSIVQSSVEYTEVAGIHLAELCSFRHITGNRW